MSSVENLNYFYDNIFQERMPSSIYDRAQSCPNLCGAYNNGMYFGFRNSIFFSKTVESWHFFLTWAIHGWYYGNSPGSNLRLIQVLTAAMSESIICGR